jgi:hypothetical protein
MGMIRDRYGLARVNSFQLWLGQLEQRILDRLERFFRMVPGELSAPHPVPDKPTTRSR